MAGLRSALCAFVGNCHVDVGIEGSKALSLQDLVSASLALAKFGPEGSVRGSVAAGVGIGVADFFDFFKDEVRP